MADYIPSGGALLLGWATHFASRTSASPTEYGLKPEEAAAIAQAVEAYRQAFTVASSLSTRTRGNILTKNAARKAMLKLLRQYGQVIKASPAVSESAKLAIRLTRPTGRTRVTAPSSRPAIHVMAVQSRRHLLRFSNVGDEQGAGRPVNAVGVQLFCHVGSAAPSEPLDARFERFISRKSCTVEFKPEQVRKTAFYFARWQTATGETGPWSVVIAMTVAG